MHILLLNDGFPPNDASSVINIMEGLIEGYESKDHKTSVITSHRTSVSPEIIRNGKVISLPISYRTSLRQWKCLGIKQVSKMLEAEISNLKPDIVHAHNIHHYLTYKSLVIARKHTPKVFLTTHDVMSFSFARLNSKRFLRSGGKNYKLTLADHWRSAELQYNPFRNFRIRNIINKNVSKVISPSTALSEALKFHGFKNVEVIHNGIDARDFEFSKDEIDMFKTKYNLLDRKVILFGGRLSIDKGAIPLLKALNEIRKEIPGVLLFVAGETRRWDGIMTAAEVHGSTRLTTGEPRLQKHIFNPGWLDQREMRLANCSADVIANPSLCLDVFPSANIEAMAADKPVVGTIYGGTPEVVVDGITGFIRNPLEQDQFTNALLTLLKDDELANKMGEAGKERLKSDFSLERQTEEYLALFNL